MASRWGIVFACLLLFCAPARAQTMDTAPGRELAPPDDTVPRKPRMVRSNRTSYLGDRLAILGHVGIAAPGGMAGLDLDVAPVPWFALSLGGGWSPSGPQLAALARLRAPLRGITKLTLGGGVSTGRYVNSQSGAGLLSFPAVDGESPATQTFARANWGNVEIGVDLYPEDDRTMARLALGYSFILNDNEYTCDATRSYPPSGGCDRNSGQGLVFFVASFGLDI